MRPKIKLAAIYKIEHNSGYYYIGMSVDVFSRWSNHYIDLKLSKHSSKDFEKLFKETKIEDWSFSILEYVSLTDHRLKTKLKGKELEKSFRSLLLSREKFWMSQYSVNFCLNKNRKNFK